MRASSIRRGSLRVLALVACVAAGALSSSTADAVVVRTAVAYHPAPVYRPAAHPVARTAAAVGTAAAIGTVVHTLPPSCTAVRVGAVAYQQCGSTWYRPAYAGTAVTYTVVAPPR